jgi:hypothetical protein
MITQAKAKALAVAYHAFGVAIQSDDVVGTVVWAKDLLQLQSDTGIEMHKPSQLISVINQLQSRCTALVMEQKSA